MLSIQLNTTIKIESLLSLKSSDACSSIDRSYVPETTQNLSSKNSIKKLEILRQIPRKNFPDVFKCDDCKREYFSTCIKLYNK